MHGLTSFALRHRGVVVAAYAGAVIASLVLVADLPNLLTNHYALPGSDSDRAEQILATRFGESTVGSFILVAQTNGSAAALLPALDAAAKRAATRLPTGSHAGTAALSEHVASAQIVSTLTASQAKRHVDSMRAAIGPLAGATTYLTGFSAIEHDLDPLLQEDLRWGELLIALPIAVLVLIWTFGTLSLLLPLLLSFCTITLTLGIVSLLAHVMALTVYVTNLVTLVGFAIAVDYSLLIVHRFREESAAGLSVEAAIVHTMATAGRSALFSGTAVGIGLAMMLFLPLPVLRGFGVGGLLIPLVSVAAALTLLPALLSLVGPQLERVRCLPRRWLAGRDDVEHGYWPGLARWVLKRPWPVALGSSLVLLALAAPTLDMHVGPGSNEHLPGRLESTQGVRLLGEAIGVGAVTPTNVVVDSHVPRGALQPATAAAIDRLVGELDGEQEAAYVYYDPAGRHSVEPEGRYAVIRIAGKDDFGAPASRDLVDRLRGPLLAQARFPPEANVFVGGAPATGRDFLGLVRASFPWLVAAILLATYVLLLLAFRSLLLPLKAIVMNLLSIGCAYGLTVVAFRWGWGAPFGLIRHAQIDAWIPVLVFAMLFGLSMDYEVFLVSRMREQWDAGAGNDEAVVTGLAKTSRLITAAGVIMCAAFLGFVGGRVVQLQQFGFALATSVLVDVTIVRALLLPATMKLFGRGNWYLPRWMERRLA